MSPIYCIFSYLERHINSDVCSSLLAASLGQSMYMTTHTPFSKEFTLTSLEQLLRAMRGCLLDDGHFPQNKT